MSSFFLQNEHIIDRIIRVIAGLGILSLAFVGPKSPWAYLGLLFVVTGAAGTCPIYRLLGINTANLGSRQSLKGQRS